MEDGFSGETISAEDNTKRRTSANLDWALQVEHSINGVYAKLGPVERIIYIRKMAIKSV